MRHNYLLHISMMLLVCIGCSDTLVMESSDKPGESYESDSSPSFMPREEPSNSSPDSRGFTEPAESNPNQDSATPVEHNSGDSVDSNDPPVNSQHRERPTQAVSTVYNDDVVTWSGLSAYPYDWIEIMNPQGPVNVYSSNDPSEIRVSVRKSGINDPIDEVNIEVFEHADGIIFCTRYPESAGEVSYQCDSEKLSLSNTNNNDVIVTYEVYIPDNMMVYVETASGPISIQGSKNLSLGTSMSGAVTINTRDVGIARTLSGAIDVSWDPSALHYYDLESVLFESMSGKVKLSIPSASAIDFTAQSTSGRINTDFNLIGEGSNSLSASINGGGHSIMVETLSGGIELRRR